MSGTTLSNGQILPPPVAMYTPPSQNVPGGMLNAAADKTIDARTHQIETAQKMGVGQKGGRKRRFRGGADNLNAHASLLPSAGSIPGVDATNLHVDNTDRLNAIRAASTGDKLANAPAYYPAKSGGKRTKRKSNGRRHHRTHRRGHRKSTRSRRRSNRHV
jgi:hypothetical protein